jgi:Lipopolysaccharide kinase (Kdo/WaaP) family
LLQLVRLHDGGLAHGDAELHNIIVCPAPLETVLIDFEAAVLRASLTDDAWQTRCEMDMVPLLREAIYLQCVLGRQTSRLGELSWQRLPQLFRSPERFRQAIETQGGV